MSYTRRAVRNLVICALAAMTLSFAGNKRYGLKPGVATGPSAKSAHATTTYDFIDVNIDNGYPWLLTNSGMISGAYPDSRPGSTSFLWRDGKVQTFRHPDYDYTGLTGVTESGRIMFGNWGTYTYQRAGYYDVRGDKWVELPDIPGYSMNFGAGMLDSGVAIGFACRQGNWDLAWDCISWVWDGKDYKTFSVPGNQTTIAYGLNHTGDIVGVYFNTTPTDLIPLDIHGFVTSIDSLPSIREFTIQYQGVTYPTALYGVSDNGAIIGSSPVNFNGINWTSFVYDRGSVTLLPNYDAGNSGQTVLSTFLTTMNERGDVAGIWFDENFGLHPVLARRRGPKF